MVVPKGGLIMGTLVYGQNANVPATKANLDSWINSINTPNTWTLDSEGKQEPLGDLFATGHDEFVLVDLQTMKVLELIRGNPRLALQKLGELLDQP